MRLVSSYRVYVGMSQCVGKFLPGQKYILGQFKLHGSINICSVPLKALYTNHELLLGAMIFCFLVVFKC